jgi:hypothetical protein
MSNTIVVGEGPQAQRSGNQIPTQTAFGETREGSQVQQLAQQPKEVDIIPAVLQIREKEAPESTLERNKEQKSNWKRIAEKIREFWGKYMVPLEPAVVLSLSGIAMIEASSLSGSLAVVATAVGVTAVGGGIFITLLWLPELVKKAMNERKEKAKQQVQEQKEENKPNIFEKVKGSLINFVEKVKKKEEEVEKKIKKAVNEAKERIKAGFSSLKVKSEDVVHKAKEEIFKKIKNADSRVEESLTNLLEKTKKKVGEVKGRVKGNKQKENSLVSKMENPPIEEFYLEVES